MRRRSQHGVALLTAMLIMALTAIITTAMVSQMSIALHRSGNIWNSQQAWWYGIGIENWIGAKLRLDAQHSKIDSLDEAWAQNVDYLPVDGGSISGRLVDLQGRFNINNLALASSGGNAADTSANSASAATDAAAGKAVYTPVDQFQRLIELVAGTDAITAQTIADSAKDWVDSDSNPTLPDGAEDDYYLGLNPAYRTANALMASPSELHMVRGMTPQIYNALLPYVTTLPTATPINVNTAPAPVLESLARDLPAGTGSQLLAIRDKQPWKSVDEFLAAGPLAGQNINPSRLAVSTHYFLISAQINVASSQTQFYSVLRRAGNGVTEVVRHSINAY